MPQYQFENNILVLKVKKSPLIIRAIIFLFAVICLILPLTGFMLTISSGKGIHIGFFIGIGLGGLLGFYMLRVALWNTFGSEIINFDGNQINYIANYGWFKDGRKTLEMISPKFSLKQVGYENDQEGILIIESGELRIQCVTIMPIEELEELAIMLNKKYLKH